MKKLVFIRAICVALAFTLVSALLYGCVSPQQGAITDNLLSLAENVYINGKKHNASSLEKEHLFFSGTGETVVEIYFSQSDPVTLNQLVITVAESKEPVILGYMIEVVDNSDNSNDFSVIYRDPLMLL